MLKYWYKDFAQYPPGHRDYWRTRLIGHTLLLSSSFFLVLTLLNIFYFESYEYAALDASGLLISLSILLFFNRTANVNLASWAVTLMVTGLILLFVASVGGYAHSLYWATLIPPFAFFLLGRQRGSLICLIAFGVCAYIVYGQIQEAKPVTFGMGSLFNVIEVSIAHIMLFRFYEGTRSSAYRQLAERNAKIQKLAETDKLTGLYNREKLDLTLEQGVQQSHHQQMPLSLLILDVDYFKQINDAYGHLAGDQVLCQLADSLKSLIRQGDFLARWGGEEFVIILPETTLPQAMKLAEQLRQDVASQKFAAQSLTISVGVSALRSDDTTKSLINRADNALYQAKHCGRNRVVAETQSPTQPAEHRALND
ncbi:GGDEF domain-containing protein [Shewanella marisflavi]|uniref:diguanylate cyclase n=1 Tax=Shewanella marisflavi TaxID=260364 RepID=A0AAC9TYK3_9GAMM|nr:GGDEF domain-containing protein [Shewanella marisflavi]ASJ95849.1 GGDEF domain-containing protein [Shewanella marisflavi]